MATVRKEINARFVTELQPITRLVSNPVYKLELNEEEAKLLYVILQFIGGDPTTSRRGIADDIEGALGQAGVPYNQDTDADDVMKNLSALNGIYFKDGTWANGTFSAALI